MQATTKIKGIARASACNITDSLPAPMPWSERRARRDRIIEAIRSGGTEESVAQTEGVSLQLVRHYSREAGVARTKSRINGREVGTNTYEILAGLLKGGTAECLAQRFSVPKQRIDRIAEKARKAGILP